MLYESVIYVGLLVLMLTSHGRSQAVRAFAALMVFNWLCVASCICYLAKDVYYYDSIDRYFLINRAEWRQLTMLPISRELLIRGMNLGALGFFFFGVLFARTFTKDDVHRLSAGTEAALVLCYFLPQALLCDPFLYEQVYRLCYPALLSAASFHRAEDALHAVAVVGNLALICLNILRMFRYAARRGSLRLVRMQTFPVAIGYSALMLFNTPLILRLPRVCTRVSIVANGFTTYNTLPLGRMEWLYIAASIINTLAIVTIVALTIWRIQVTRRFENDQLVLSQRIDAANTTSKVFCHYVKNEVLALEAELEDLSSSLPEASEAVSEMRQRCARLYQRLDEAHRSTRQDSLHLRATPLMSPIRAALDTLDAQLTGFEVRLPEGENPKVMLDMGCFTLCIEDVLRNAIEACEELPAERRRIELAIGRIPGYVTLTVRDHGKGIDDKEISRLFTPFYSTKPAKHNWGVGLSLVYRVVHAHGGDVSLRNASGEGVCVRILLPSIAEESKV